MSEPTIINGKHYPLYQQFIDKKEQWIGGVLEELSGGFGCEGGATQTKITGIELTPNGKDSAYFAVSGELYSCGFAVSYGGIGGGEAGWITFFGYGGHQWRIKAKS